MRPVGLESLPMGYTRLDFLESTGTQFIKTGLNVGGLNSIVDFASIEIWPGGSGAIAMYLGCYNNGNVYQIRAIQHADNTNPGNILLVINGTTYVVEKKFAPGTRLTGEINLTEGYISINNVKKTIPTDLVYPYPETHVSLFAQNTNPPNNAGGNGQQQHVPPIGRVYRFLANYAGVPAANYVPTLDPTGTPCMFDTVTKKPFKNNGTGQFIAGFTMNQALNLANLPSTGGSLTISLPKEASLVQHNQEVEAALETAAEKGWNIPVQYREAGEEKEIINKYAECETILEVSTLNPNWKTDITNDGEWIYPLTNAVSLYDAQNFPYQGFFNASCPATKIYLDAPKLTSANYLFNGGNAKKIYINAPSLTNWAYGLMHNYAVEEIEGNLPNLHNANLTWYFSRNYKLRSVKIDFPKLGYAHNFLTGAILDKESALRILNSIPSYTSGSHQLTLGIHIDHQNDEEVLAAIALADIAQTPVAEGGKGWTLEIQWNGTPTAQTASTFGLRKPPIYAKLGTMELPDGTIEQHLSWGHYVTNWEENGYQEFASIEEAEEHFNIKKETEE
jgi:hypothetical protein